VYGITKRDQKELALVLGRAYGLETYLNVYGPRQALANPYTGVAAIFAARILNGRAPRVFEDGGQIRDLVHVSDVVRATLAAMDAPAAPGHAINVATGRTVTVGELARRLATALDSELSPKITREFRAGDIRHCFADVHRAEQLLGFRPRRSLAEGLPQLAEWVAAQKRARGRRRSDRRPAIARPRRVTCRQCVLWAVGAQRRVGGVESVCQYVQSITAVLEHQLAEVLQLELAASMAARQEEHVVREYGKVVGVTVVVIGILGLLLGQRSLFGALNIDVAEDLIHLATGGLLAYVGFSKRNSEAARSVVGGIGIVYLLVGAISFAEPNPLGLFPSEYSVLDNAIHLTLGVLAIAVAWVFPPRGKAESARAA